MHALLILTTILLLPMGILAEVKSTKNDKGVTFTTRNNNLTYLAAKTSGDGRKSGSIYFRSYWVATFIGWTDEALARNPDKCLFQRRINSGTTSKNESLGLSYAFIRRGKGKEVFQVAHKGEIIDAYYVSRSNEMTPLTDHEFTEYRKLRAASKD